MTVCIAALCKISNQYAIVGASDRMYTWGNAIGFERSQTKIAQITDGIVALIAGDPSAQLTLYDSTCSRVRGTDNSGITVRDVANIYAEEFRILRRKQAEIKILAPLGYDLASFHAASKTLPDNYLEKIRNELTECELGIETIIAGVGNEGAHVFTILDPGLVEWSNSIGYAAIGIGDQQALSHFMFSRYKPGVDIVPALLTTYSAKRRAEVVHGVGQETDMFIIAAGRYSKLSVPTMYAVDTVYESLQKSQGDNYDDAVRRLNEQLGDVISEVQSKKQEERQGDTGVDQGQIRGDAT